jgi:hypothetical protein
MDRAFFALHFAFFNHHSAMVSWFTVLCPGSLCSKGQTAL